jgi:hypothetical protein
MAEININDLQEYDFKNAQKGDIVVVATINYGELQSFETCLVKSVSPKMGYVTLDNGLRYSKDGYEYGRDSFSRNYHRVLVDNEEIREMVNSYTAQKDTARKIMTKIPKININRLMQNSSDNCRKLSLVLDEILEGGE